MRGPLTLRLLFAALALSPGASATVIRVPEQVGRINVAIHVALPYDTILVSPGVYEENLDWPATVGLKLLSEDGPEMTIIDGGANESVINIAFGVDTTTVVRGFTIRNGYTDGM